MKAKPKSILSLLCLLAFTSFITGCGETVIDAEKMQERGDLVYTVNQEKPFTGVVVKRYENGQKDWEQRYKGGVKSGRWIEWYDNGQMYSEGSYKDGLKVGKWTKWYENGQKGVEANYIDGKLHGQWTSWSHDGQLWKEKTYEYDHVIDYKNYQPDYP